MKIVCYKPKATIALGMAFLVLFSFVFPVSASNTKTDPQHDASVLVLYDESYAKFISEIIELDPETRLEQVLDYACLSFKQSYNINISYDIGTYESYIGTPFSSSLQYPNECSDLWSWDTTVTPPDRLWDHLYGTCTCVSDNQCYSFGSPIGHHTSSQRYFDDMHNYMADALNPQYDFIFTFVGHRICYSWPDGSHGYYGGLTIPAPGWMSTVAAGMIDYPIFYYQVDYDNIPNGDLSAYHVCNFLSNVRIFQHEVSHIFQAHDGVCTTDSPCIMSGGFDGVVYAENIWCNQCTSYFTEDLFD